MGAYEKIEEYFNEIDIPESRKKEYCQYYDGGDYHCKATSHKTCSRCKFFCPTIHGKMEIIAKSYAEIKKRNIALRKKQTEQDKVIDWLRKSIQKESRHDAEQ